MSIAERFATATKAGAAADTPPAPAPSIGERFAAAMHTELPDSSSTTRQQAAPAHHRTYSVAEKSDIVEHAVQEGVDHTAAERHLSVSTLQGFVEQSERRSAVAPVVEAITAAKAGVAGGKHLFGNRLCSV